MHATSKNAHGVTEQLQLLFVQTSLYENLHYTTSLTTGYHKITGVITEEVNF